MIANPIRYCARVLIEAETPLTVGSGYRGLNIDQIVASDANELPMIPGTSICGVLRHLMTEELRDKYFGTLNIKDNKESFGSRLIISSARILGEEGEVLDGLIASSMMISPFYRYLINLPLRDHCRINVKGVADAEGHGKFDEQVVYKGARFCFDMELIGDESNEDKEYWKKLLQLLFSPVFRIGAGTRNGFGEIKVVRIVEDIYNLKSSLNDYLSRSSKLSVLGDYSNPRGNSSPNKLNGYRNPGFSYYSLTLKPDDFFSFGAGHAEGDVDSVPKKEKIIAWDDKNEPVFSEDYFLIPATSLKGAISHRVAYHYNKLTGKTIENCNGDFDACTGENNKAVRELFGYAKDSKAESKGKLNNAQGLRGRVILSDVFIPSSKISKKRFNHVAIDSFTGGAIAGALFDEIVCSTEDDIVMDFYVEESVLNDNIVRQAFEKALKDISTGMLPLGGSVMKGHGCFSGKILLNGEEL